MGSAIAWVGQRFCEKDSHFCLCLFPRPVSTSRKAAKSLWRAGGESYAGTMARLGGGVKAEIGRRDGARMEDGGWRRKAAVTNDARRVSASFCVVCGPAPVWVRPLTQLRCGGKRSASRPAFRRWGWARCAIRAIRRNLGTRGRRWQRLTRKPIPSARWNAGGAPKCGVRSAECGAGNGAGRRGSDRPATERHGGVALRPDLSPRRARGRLKASEERRRVVRSPEGLAARRQID